ncbi:HD domain-containing protein [Patescibacteria group bacterium]|nr:HD domain-containing protein [Patescibacteria group bacterium]
MAKPTIERIEGPHEPLGVIVDKAINNIPNPDSEVITDQFRDTCKMLVHEIALKRGELDFRLYDRDEIIMFVNELYNTAELHHGRPRKDGSSYFYDHLVGTVFNLIRHMSVAGIVSMIAGIKHDDKEDRKEQTDERTLLPYERYQDQLSDDALEQAKRTRQHVSQLVDGVTKVRGRSKEATSNETFRKLLNFIYRYGVRVALIKIADRIHNIRTIKGHTNPVREMGIIQETLEIYVPLAQMLKLYEVEEELLRGCLEYLNSDLLVGVDKTIKRQNKMVTEPQNGAGQNIKEILESDEDFSLIANVHFSPRPITKVLGDIEWDVPTLQSLKVTDIPVDEYDPMLETVILAHQEFEMDDDSG